MSKLISFLLLFPTIFFSQNKLVVEYAEIWGSNIHSCTMIENNNKTYFFQIGNEKNTPSAEQILSENYTIKDIGYLISRENNLFYLTGLIPKLRNTIAEDNAPPIQWKITNETSEILGFPCKKAIGNFRGREVYAYFTPQISTNSGPWKYYGLPGLILKAGDSDDKIVFVATRVLLNSKLDVSDKLHNHIDEMMLKKITIKEFVVIENDFIIKMKNRIRASSPPGTFWLSDYLRSEERELQFEWEKEPLKIQSDQLINAEQKQIINAINNKNK